MATDECIVIERMYVYYKKKIKNKQKEWHPATKPFSNGNGCSSGNGITIKKRAKRPV
jgi:hypothetical protein